MRTALVTGIGGQDGSYLAEQLVDSGYTVIGIVSNIKSITASNIQNIRESIEINETNLLDQTAIEKLLARCKPTEIYNLAALHPSSTQSYDPIASGELNGLTVLRILEAIRSAAPTIRFCQASTAQVFGQPSECPQSEATRFLPTNPYGIAKLYGQLVTAHYRQSYGLFACSSILFNHESPRRDPRFVTRKITLAVARIKAGLQRSLQLEDLEARRDWGYAPDYARGMWMMLQAPCPDDYILATGKTHSVREFCRVAFGHVGLDYERYVTQQTKKQQDVAFPDLVGNAEKARAVLGWQPTLSFEDMVSKMVDADVDLLDRDQAVGMRD